VCFIVPCPQDLLGIGTCDLDHPISSWGKKTPIVGMPGRGICSELLLNKVRMVPSSSITITAHGERLTCGGFSLGEPVCLGNFKFIVDYFGGLSLSLRRGNDGTIFMGSAHNGASTPRSRTPPRSFSCRRVGKEGSTTFPPEGAAWGPR
jgi:hypothetical protein